MAAVTKIFTHSAHYYMLIGNGLNVKVSDLMPIPGAADTNLMLVFQRWFDADKDVNWDTLIKLCDDFPDQLGKAKSNLLVYNNKGKKLYCLCVCTLLMINGHSTLKLNTLGQPISDNVSSHTVLPSPADDISNTPVTNIRGDNYSMCMPVHCFYVS